ncbi:DUF4391 domain-containing protein [Dyadobacter sediminis]|uniref:DUF4391 domain-containing protein n=1 Tax=Dyadobacter sediminis TaxID=1493691 RepID=A0A5R9KJZ8_9BACT|nr:DUF4391 domain-containing protein [Dyadobacter sediminis]TLU96548.1 DUF4391 domain-containing protein [Dyadobacter sediminis]GGB83132.1 hypothetical protein GCM10011325_08350 [Dyadobacter sediminis]
MNLLNLPSTTRVDKIIPKNAFDTFTTSQQKKKFVDLVERIRWSNKLSSETINLSGTDIREIQIFLLELRNDEGFEELLEIINRAVPYPIIFCVVLDDKVMFSACQKHPHPTNADVAIVDWVYKSEWLGTENHSFELHLRRNLDFVYFDFCRQLSGKSEKITGLAELTIYEQKIKKLSSSISKLESEVAKCKQFNKRVELNIELQKKKAEYKELDKEYN